MENCLYHFLRAGKCLSCHCLVFESLCLFEFWHHAQVRGLKQRPWALMFTLFYHCLLRNDRTHTHTYAQGVQLSKCLACCREVALLWMPSWSFCYISVSEAWAEFSPPRTPFHLLSTPAQHPHPPVLLQMPGKLFCSQPVGGWFSAVMYHVCVTHARKGEKRMEKLCTCSILIGSE